MKIHCEEHRSAIVIAIEGEFVFEEVDSFRRRCQEWLDRTGVAIIVDCSRMERVDSAGLEALLRLSEDVRRCEGHLCLSGLQDLVGKALVVTRLDHRFDVHLSLEDAARTLSRMEAA